MKRAFIFPGQGSQFVGMGKSLFDNFKIAQDVFNEIDEALKIKLSQIIFFGPSERLTLTENTQPALMAVSMAIIKIMEKEFDIKMSKIASFAAGHSLGEFSALAAAGTISLSDTAKLLRIRGKAMQLAAPIGSGLMAAMIGCSVEDVQEIIKEAQEIHEDQICQIANINCPGQIVISGHVNAIRTAIKIASSKSKKAVALSVSAPFHSQLMEPAKGPMLEAFSGVSFTKPSVPIVANVIAKDITEVDMIKECLIAQISGSVKWQESIELMIEKGVTEFISIGAGTVLAGLNKRINRDVKVTSISDFQDITLFAKEMSAIA